MTLVSNDPSWWLSINAYSISSYYIVAAYVVLLYDWALTFGQEVELIVRRRWSLMTVLYLTVRYGGMIYAVIRISFAVPTFSTTDAVIIRIANAVMAAVITMKISGVHDWLHGIFPISGFHNLDTCHCMGGPCTVSRGLDRRKALS
ncbi:hypothetical protein CY34DRAFT_695086 [Suillus luteus UH-Slu-Lm8-n1]|uniref:Unplaced genomic scaffold CY34scaffold_78, whole genome shotgun sequence n=1 Tax=Suillus luteus UH-Slu-Lm8-n1 TaxID=930992 RepID=A0A0D0B0P4_9AGAM|nr:hypothetical protein CY34DRAFT_695086 [Suillus luteus UH-Slu-Lm8-n1]